ncbi:DUF4350 domain-containing protein [Microbacterium esteraromaticum]|uniref:DUF4350 domain-containing protein n=1 Tax=Microbacterium esteraromaticum TaxID=57043 RepID=UPI00195F1A67|nr:DUF4350 domain-containing protein [Microbacterium esteraromaticum]MBM7467140.1 hypothetical protein [Microbacterium esteraromaticum]
MSALAAVGDDVTSSTAAPRRPGRRTSVLGWLLVAVLLVGIALLSLRLVTTAPSLAGVLNPESPGPGGAKAIAELVRQQGTEVEVVRSRAAATTALDPGGTLVLADPVALSDEAVLALIGEADRVVLLSTSTRMLDLLDLGAGTSGLGSVAARCDRPEFAATGAIEAERMFLPADDVVGCFRSADGGAALLLAERDGAQLAFIEASRMLSNRHLAENGNAALGLALLAQTEHVVWYAGSFEDGDRVADEPASLGDLTPTWLTPAILLLLLAGIAAIWWRGSRFGPLVSESLPVTVRASETMHGRARLTAKAADAPHAAAAIRSGTRARLARRLALSPRATPVEIADAASDRLGVPRGSLHDLLDGAPPADDRELIELARRLAELETAVDTAHTERNRP